MEAAARGWPIWMCDPKTVEFIGLRRWPNVQIVATSVADMVVVVLRAQQEMERRYAMVEAEQADDDEFEPLVVVLDEYRARQRNHLHPVAPLGPLPQHHSTVTPGSPKPAWRLSVLPRATPDLEPVACPPGAPHQPLPPQPQGVADPWAEEASPGHPAWGAGCAETAPEQGFCCFPAG